MPRNEASISICKRIFFIRGKFKKTILYTSFCVVSVVSENSFSILSTFSKELFGSPAFIKFFENVALSIFRSVSFYHLCRVFFIYFLQGILEISSDFLVFNSRKGSKLSFYVKNLYISWGSRCSLEELHGNCEECSLVQQNLEIQNILTSSLNLLREEDRVQKDDCSPEQLAPISN